MTDDSRSEQKNGIEESNEEVREESPESGSHETEPAQPEEQYAEGKEQAPDESGEEEVEGGEEDLPIDTSSLGDEKEAQKGPTISFDLEELEGGDGEMPTAGAGEGMVRALHDLKVARDEVEEVQAKAKASEERLLRLGAEFDNYKKRVKREREDEKKFANERLLKELLPVIDNLERAVSASDCAESSDQIVSGVEMVLRQTLETLKKFGVTPISAKNEPFNPEIHEAMQQVETSEVPAGTVVTEYVKGYILNDRLLRPSMVVVAKAPEGQDEGKDETTGDGVEAGGSEENSPKQTDSTGSGEAE